MNSSSINEKQEFSPPAGKIPVSRKFFILVIIVVQQFFVVTDLFL